jgi:hypothetical protein
VEARIIAGVAKFPRGTVRTFPRDMDPLQRDATAGILRVKTGDSTVEITKASKDTSKRVGEGLKAIVRNGCSPHIAPIKGPSSRTNLVA